VEIVAVMIYFMAKFSNSSPRWPSYAK